MANIAKDPQVALGRAIRLRREELGISQQELGLELGYDQGWISHIENGRTNPAYGTVDRLARALECPYPSSSRSLSPSRRKTVSRSIGPARAEAKRLAITTAPAVLGIFSTCVTLCRGLAV